MQTSSRRVVIATALAGLAGGCAPVALASEGITTSAIPLRRRSDQDAELLRAGAEFDRCLAEYDAATARYNAAASRHDPDLRELGGLVEDECDVMEEAADKVMALQPTTLAGLALWARMMCWRFDADIRGIVPKPPENIAEFGVNEAFALAVAIERMASMPDGSLS